MKPPQVLADAGLILVDPEMSIVAADKGALMMLEAVAHVSGKADLSVLPAEILRKIGAVPGAEEPPSVRTSIRIGKEEYMCRVYILKTVDDGTLPHMFGIHFEKDWTASDAIDELAARYHLTSREQQVLRGISLGLATKELAAEMDISPNTVKAFVRLVMIKMGVSTRAGAIAKLLRDGKDDEPESDNQMPIQRR